MASFRASGIFCLFLTSLCGCGSGPQDQDEAAAAEAASTHDELRCEEAVWEGTDLGMLPPADPGGSSEATAVNERRTAVGYSQVLFSPGVGAQRAFRWKPETGMVDLGTLGGLYSSATDVNDREQVAGSSVLPDDTLHAVIWDAQNRIRDLGTLGGTQSYALAINHRGQVIGMSETTPDRYRPFIWSADTGMIELDLPGDYAVVSGINDFGVVVGTILEGDRARPFEWTKHGGVVEFDTLGFAGGEATAINNRGEIAGYVYETGASDPWVAAKWTRHGGELLPNVPNHHRARPKAINEAGVIVGEEITSLSLTLAMRWDTGGRRPRVSPGPSESLANDVNDRGDIVGVWNTGHRHATMWQRRSRKFW
jgi:probable HAF family extracellular repeat protein